MSLTNFSDIVSEKIGIIFMEHQFKLALATDLDGTFLEGNDEVKRFFYPELSRLRNEILLLYTTGRSVDTVEYFCRNKFLPYPHYIIADHGTHIVEGENFTDLEDLQYPISKAWNNGNERLKHLLSNEIGIELQPINPPYRVAYYYDLYSLKKDTLQKINEHGYDYILSCDMYLDIVPHGVNKGSSLLKLANYLSINHEIIVTCGDSLNDLSLFQTGLKSIAVGNSEPKLVTEIQKLNNVYHSKHAGLLGIIDGLEFYQNNLINLSQFCF